MKLESWLRRVWYADGAGGWLLLPLSVLFIIAAAARRLAYRIGLLPSRRVGVPVVVVGNVTAGGSGKTPLVIWLAGRLRSRGLSVGVVARGYGSRRNTDSPVMVTDDSDAAETGDEPSLIHARAGVPVVVSRDRHRAAAMIEDRVDLIIADDGLQHYGLARDVEIAVVDGRRRFGNGRFLPAGPLREPISRLDVVDLVVINGGQPRGRSEVRMDLVGEEMSNLADGRTMTVGQAVGRRWHALAGIGDPDRFFDGLEARGLEIVRHPLPDHAGLDADALDFGDDLPVIMTEKDAVKCRAFADERCWVLPVEARFAPGDEERLLGSVLDCLRHHQADTG